LDLALALLGFVAEAVLVGLLVYKRIYKTLPLFSFYIAWSLVDDVGGFLLTRYFSNTHIFGIFVASTIIDSIFMFCVLVEVSMAVLKPARAFLPRWMALVVAALFALLGAVVWHFVKFPGFENIRGDYALYAHLQLSVAAVRLLFFLLLAAFSQLLAIGWRDRELQIATGFGFYALASLSVAMFHWSLGAGNPALDHQYHLLDEMATACYIGSLVYWVFCFAQEVPERREFTPQMQSFLLAVAGNARATRMAMSSRSKSDSDSNSRR
jgi:hypothetical protein